MTPEEITKQTNAVDVIAELKKKAITVPSWDKLEKEYNPRKHPVMYEPEFADKVKRGRIITRTRITYAWQRLATNRMSELLFALPVKYITKPINDAERTAALILKDVLKRNRIDTLNLDRARKLYSSCEVMTIWFSQDVETEYGNERTNKKLRCRTFSPMDNDFLYPLFDEYDDLVALSVAYTRNEGRQRISYFDTYTDTEHVRWRSDGGQYVEEIREQITIGKICGVYGYRSTPIWEDKSENIYDLERTMSRNGNYLRKNSRPTWVEFTEKPRKYGREAKEEGDRNIINLGANDKAGYQTWEQSVDSLKFQVSEIKQNYFMDLQLPDMSTENMKATPMSGEARKMMFIDAQLKAGDESGMWSEYLDREVNVLRAMLKELYPSLAPAFESLDVEVKITPYQIRDLAERVQCLGSGTGGKPIISQRTAIRELDLADNEDAEIEQIATEEENAYSDLTQLPTE